MTTHHRRQIPSGKIGPALPPLRALAKSSALNMDLGAILDAPMNYTA